MVSIVKNNFFFFILYFLLSFSILNSIEFETEEENSQLSNQLIREAIIEADKKKIENTVSFEWEFDPYYVPFDLIFSLTNDPVPDVGTQSEFFVYKDLLFNSYKPRFIILEASINPMPILGVLIKKEANDFYNKAGTIDDYELINFNIIQAITEGFEEPYALSLFLGNLMQFNLIGQAEKETNKAYTGILFSFADYHIKDNELIKDWWYEFEYKFKGKRVFSHHELKWSFRIGAKMHTNQDITDVLYFSIKRSRIDRITNVFSIFNNSGIEYRLDFDMRKWHHISHYFILEKIWPLDTISFSLKLGMIYQLAEKYTGVLANETLSDEIKFIIVPNLLF